MLASGFYGFFVNKSPWALIMGIIVGIILMGNAYATFHHNFTGVYITIIISIILTAVCGIRLTKTLSVLPVGLMFIASAVSLGFSVYSLSFKKSVEND